MHKSLERLKMVKWVFHPIISLQGWHSELRRWWARCDSCYEGRVSAMYQTVKYGYSSLYSVHHKIHFILHCLHLSLLSCTARFGLVGRCIFPSSSPTRSIALSLIFFMTTIPQVVMIIALLVIVGFRSLLTQLFNPYPQRLILLHEGFIRLGKSFNSSQVHL